MRALRPEESLVLTWTAAAARAKRGSVDPEDQAHRRAILREADRHRAELGLVVVDGVWSVPDAWQCPDKAYVTGEDDAPRSDRYIGELAYDP